MIPEPIPSSDPGPRPIAAPADLIAHFEKVIVGKRETLTMMLAALIADGHVLIEDVPGVAKTIAARTLARSFDLSFARVQMTPDLLPADLTGTSIWDEPKREFIFRPGPIFAQVLLADELNRATPRTQSGLLEAMEERSVSAEGRRHPLPKPFFVIATQNPIEQFGVFPLPEAQLDRFLIQIGMGYPTHGEETMIVEAQSQSHPIDAIGPILSAEGLMRLRGEAAAIHVSPAVLDYMVRIVRATREREQVALGASPRASIALHRISRALALIAGENFVRPDHVKQAAPAVLRHRVILTPQARLAGTKTDEVIGAILQTIDAPIYEG
ncbi:MoxR family ATPase [Candidatus Sumerlaeota bacterium]|nr:MoxR family ATPase [Candidatus Sumerlaeota bacterium]MBI3734944.1 MoxR family ATPase [Candidatus Sumerlaeota bacterium]